MLATILSSLILLKTPKFLTFISISEFKFSDINKVYSNIQTPKNIRKEINNLTLNFKFDLINKIAEFDNLVVNKKEISQLNEILENYNNNVIKLNSVISFKKFINDMLSYYSG